MKKKLVYQRPCLIHVSGLNTEGFCYSGSLATGNPYAGTFCISGAGNVTYCYVGAGAAGGTYSEDLCASGTSVGPATCQGGGEVGHKRGCTNGGGDSREFFPSDACGDGSRNEGNSTACFIGNCV